MAEDLPSATATKKTIDTLVGDIYSYLKTKVSTGYKSWQTASAIETMAKRYRSIRYVKTLWQLEKEIDIDLFYVPPSVLVNNKRMQVNSIAGFRSDGSLIIEGTIGQGKSIFLRYLAMRTLSEGRQLPIFVELRRVEGQASILGHLLQELKTLGLEMSPEVFANLASAGRFVVFLDGFDEVPEGQRAGLISELERLIQAHESCRFIVTSRPSGDIQKSASFRVFKLAPLENTDYQKIIRKITDKSIAEGILQAIKSSASDVESLLTTPLMATLLVVRHNIVQSIPENEAAFFGDLFDLLLHRHDKMKAGYIRPRKSGMTDSQLRDALDALCYILRKERDSGATLEVLRSRAAQALQKCDNKADPGHFIDDIVKITCMILVEGSEFKFIHRSVLEYHAASFVRSRPEQISAKFYGAVQQNWFGWRQELNFLRQLDEYRFFRYFLIPHFSAILGPFEGGRPDSVEITPQLVRKVFGSDFLICGSRGDGTFRPATHESGLVAWPSEYLEFFEAHDLAESVPSIMGGKKIAKDEKLTVKISSLMDTESGAQAVMKVFVPHLERMRSDLIQATARVEKATAPDGLFDL